jgi:hypothetical protein
MPRRPYHPPKAFLPRCRELREARALSITQLAAAAGVDRGLITSLEQGAAHTVPKVRAVFNALNGTGAAPLSADDELLPLRFLPNCRTLREGCKLSINALAARAGVGRAVVEDFERHHGGTAGAAEAVFAVLAACSAKRGGATLDPAREITPGPD